MSANADAFYDTWSSRMSAAKTRAPEIGRAFAPFFQGLMKDSGDGGLSGKHKELIALGIGVAVRCDHCIYTHVEKCLKLGATSKEVMEAVGVAVMMGGGPVYTYLAVVSEALEHFERHPVVPAHA